MFSPTADTTLLKVFVIAKLTFLQTVQWLYSVW